MNLQIFILSFLVLDKSFGFKSNHQVDRLSKSIFSNKKGKESFTPARYKVGLKCINFDQGGGQKTPPGQCFPEVEYPTNIMEASRPFFYSTGDCDAMLRPFPDDVKSSYKSLLDKNREAFEELKIKYMDDIGLNVKKCIEEYTDTTSAAKNIEDGIVLEEDGKEFVVETVEVVSGEVSQNTVESTQEDIAIEENEMIEITSVSDEAINNENQEYYEQEPQVLNTDDDNGEVISEDYFTSWESEQFF